MSATDQLSRVTPYVSRLLEDQYVQDQLGAAFTNLVQGSQRARRKGPKQAVQDRKLHRQLRDAVVALTAAVEALQKPRPRKRRFLKGALLLAVTAAGSVFAWQRFVSNSSGGANG